MDEFEKYWKSLSRSHIIKSSKHDLSKQAYHHAMNHVLRTYLQIITKERRGKNGNPT